MGIQQGDLIKANDLAVDRAGQVSQENKKDNNIKAKEQDEQK